MECHGYGHLHRFQSTLPNGSDVYYGELEVGGWNFNPRSQTGATNLSCGLRNGTTFQSTLPNGSDGSLTQVENRSITFQSTLPNGSDGEAYCDQAGDHNFNPRSQTGATTFALQVHITFQFQSTLPNGSDEYSAFLLSASRISIHAPKRERL